MKKEVPELSLAYGIIAIISLSMVGICVLADKKRDEWLIWLFVSVALCNLGYFMVSVSKELDAALNSNRIAYLGSVFLPFFLLMMVQRFCKIKRIESRFFVNTLTRGLLFLFENKIFLTKVLKSAAFIDTSERKL